MANDRRNTFVRVETDQDYGTCDDCGKPIKGRPILRELWPTILEALRVMR